MGKMADMVFKGIPKDTVPKATCVSANWMTSRHLKTTMFPKFSRSLRDHTFQNFDFCGTQNFLRFFSPSFRWVRLGSACGLASGVAPEVTHPCIWQQGTATSGLSNGSSRPRRSRMRRETNVAVASDVALLHSPKCPL